MTAPRPAAAPRGAAPFVPPKPTIERLREAAQQCRGCELYHDATQAVMGDGPRDALVMLIGEQPGDKEDLAGEPFVGPAGTLLDRALDEAGIVPQTVFRTNAVKHFRFSGTRGKRRIHASPDRVHVLACQPWLEAELKLITPQGVVLLGATAGKALLGPKFKVTEARGHLQPWPEVPTVNPAPAWVLPTAHPAAVLRSSDRDVAYQALVADLRVAAAELN